MAKKKKHKTKVFAPHRQNLPTQERMLHGNIAIRSNVAQVEEPLRIDKLLRGGIIDEMQHLYGMQIITLWNIMSRPFIKTMQYNRLGGLPPDVALLNLSRMSAEDQFYKTMKAMRTREHDLITKICFEEMGAIEAGRAIGLPVNSITVYVRGAFDALGNALARMREERKALRETEVVCQ